MSMLAGVYSATKKDGTKYFRSSITHKLKHISLGSFDTETLAHECYLEAGNLLNSQMSIEDYQNIDIHYLSFEKWVCLINYRDNGIYFKTPIYMHPKYFIYYYDALTTYKFDVDDLFFYSTHKITKRGGHLFVADYGMQLNILSRYGIKNYAVAGKDYVFVNGDSTDFRYENIKIINKYNGVSVSTKNGRNIYTAKIHINGDYIIGRYQNEDEAAAAYNKAGRLLKEAGIINAYSENYIEGLSSIQYASLHAAVKISDKLLKLVRQHSVSDKTI